MTQQATAAAEAASYDDLCRAVQAAGLVCRGGFHPLPEDGVPPFADGAPAATVVLLGFVGSAQWPPFLASQERADGERDPLDRWSRRVIDALAAAHGAVGLYPMQGPPWLPFQRWAMRAEPVHGSPLGISIHPQFGLWHAYRGALAFRRRLSVPAVPRGASPCERCTDKPCLTSCPADAVGAAGYDHRACAAHVASPAGADCLQRGCLARRRCPIGAAYRYQPDQAQFHMAAFIGRRCG